MPFLLFVFGAAIGSFLNVVSLRYNPQKFLLHGEIIGGRSRCPNCRKTLRWFELVPIVSFVSQRGRCRRCKSKISFQYPIVEILSGFIFVSVPIVLGRYFYILHSTFYILAVLWILALLALLLISLIDLRLGLIPDEANIFLAILAFLIIVVAGSSGFPPFSFLGPYAAILGLGGNWWLNRLVAMAIAAIIFGGIIAATRGHGMGIGDLKLGTVLGFLFGWPDIILVIIFSFIIGAAVGIAAILGGKKTMKSSLPFGPFLALGAALVFFCGSYIVRAYLGIFGLGLF